MVPAASWKSTELLSDGFASFNKVAVSSLQRIISETKASIVLTTSHKSNFTLEEWKRIFNRRGIQIEEINKLPDNNLNLNRKDEILNWLNQNLVHDFVIIDDDKSLNALPEPFKQKLVLTSALIGLNQELVGKVIDCLRAGE